MPLRCEHRGSGRVAHTPLVVVSGRRDGKPRQRVIERFPTIRSCCIADGFNRAAWWHRVDLIMSSWSEMLSSDPVFVDYSRDAPDMLRKLRALVPRPTPRWAAEFAAYRGAREAEHDAREREERREWRAREARAREEYARRSHEEALRDILGGRRRMDCLVVLGLGTGASPDQVKARYRELAKTHHPDRGGDAAEFNRISEAYQAALDIAGRGAMA